MPSPVTGGGSSGSGGDASAANQAAELVLEGAVTETAPASDTASSGLNGRLQRIAQRITSLMALLPASIGAKNSAGSLSVTSATDDPNIALMGAVTETAPATDTASSGQNGRLQRIAQRLTSLIALLPTSLGGKVAASSLAVTTATDDPPLALLGPVAETAPASDTASSGLNGRLQRIAQRLTSLMALFPASLGQKTKAASLAVTLASDEDITAVLGTTAGAGVITDTTGTIQQYLRGLVKMFAAGTVNVTITKTGPPNIAVNQVALSTAAATAVVARATRRGVTIKNIDAAITIYVGPATVTAANGMPVKAGESVVINWVGLVQAIAASGTPSLAYIDEYD